MSYPLHWMVCKLPDVIYFQEGPGLRKYQYRESGIPFLNIRTLVKEKVDLTLCKYLDVAEVEKTYRHFLLNEGDIVCSTSGTLGKTAVIRQQDLPLMLNTSVIRFRTLDDQVMLQRFIHLYLKSELFLDQALSASTGSAQVNVGPSHLSTFDIPLPPLNEQKRIAAKLDALLERVDACRAHLERVPLLLKRLRQAVLAAATSGQLTEDWRESRSHNQDDKLTRLEEVALDFSYGTSAKSSKSGAVPVLRMGNIQDGRLDWYDLVFTSDQREIEKYALEPGDVLFNRTNSPELVGKTAVFKGERQAIYAGYLIRVRCGESLLPDYLNYCLNSPAGRDYCWRVKSDGVSQSNINAKKVADFEFVLPSIEEQAVIVRRVETLFAYADRLEARYKQARAEVDRLTPALLAKAFRGELVPQDPNDEPASVMLERLKAARATAEATLRSRATTKPVAAPVKKEESTAAASTTKEIATGRAAFVRPTAAAKKATRANNEDRPAPLDIDDYDRETLLAAIREVFTGGTRLDAESAIRAISRTLGYARTGPRIHERLKNTLRVAVVRGILVNEAGEYRLDGRSIADYTHDECITTLLAALPRGWTEREDAIRAAARHLGFRRTGPALHDAFKSAINGAIRRGLLEYDRETIRKIG